jgi:antitoxin component YwqK of YwqJK toxin-antitoxin module
MKRTLNLLLIIFLCKASFAQKHITTYYDYTKVHPKADYYVNSVGQRNGAYKEYTQYGVVVEESSYLNGLKNGLCVTYWVGDENKRTVSGKVTYRNGKLDGPYTAYNKDGVPYESGTYVNDRKEGKWTLIQPYYDVDFGEAPEGFRSIKTVQDFKAGENVTTGRVKVYYYPSGKLFRDFEMKNGEDAEKADLQYYPNGVLKLWYKVDSAGYFTTKQVYYPTGKTIRFLRFEGRTETQRLPSDTSWAFMDNGDTTALMRKSLTDYANWKKTGQPAPAKK